MNKKQLNGFQQFISDNNNNPYQILKCSKHDSQDLILKNYKKLRLKVKESQSSEEELNRLDFAFKLLSDEKLKKMYDERDENQSRLKRERNDLLFKTMDFISALVGFACERSAIIVQTLSSSKHIGIFEDSKFVINQLYQRGRGLNGFYRGTLFIFTLPAIEIARYSLSEYIYKSITHNNKTQSESTSPSSIYYTLYQVISSNALMYPFIILNQVISLSPPEISPYKIFKLMFWDSSSSSSSSNKLSVWYYGFTYYVGISLVNGLIKQIINRIGLIIDASYEKSKVKSMDGNGNSILKYLNSIYNNKFSRILLDVLLSSPLYCIRSYYPLQILNSILNGNQLLSPVPSPYSIFNNIYSSHGLPRFYNSSILIYISKLSKELLYDFKIEPKDFILFD